MNTIDHDEEVRHFAEYILNSYIHANTGPDHHDAVLSFYRYIFGDAAIPDEMPQTAPPYLPEIINEAAQGILEMQMRLYPLIDYTVIQCEGRCRKDQFAEVMLVALRDMNAQLSDLHELI